MEATRDALALVAGWVAEAGLHAQLNPLVGDGETLVATRFAAGRAAQGTGGEPPSLYTLAPRAGAAFIASEALDDQPGWSRVAPGTLVVVDRQRELAHVPLDQARSIAS